MKLEKQVTSLKLSKKLKELGVKQESVFYWLTGRKTEFEDFSNKGEIEFAGGIKDLNDTRSKKYRRLLANEKAGFGLFSAFTVAELGERLRKKDSRWCDLLASKTINSKTEANARAKMLIYLIENKLLQGGEKNG